MSEAAFATLERWEYRDTAAPPPPPPAQKMTAVTPTVPVAPSFTEEQVLARVQTAVAEAKQHWAADTALRETRRISQLQVTLDEFAGERARYFRHAEREVVQLALAVARKILHREASLDPELLAALVRIALERMDTGPTVRLRVPAAEFTHWQQHGIVGSGYTCELAADASLATGDCVVETELGTANFGFEVQLKEIEQGMLDLLEGRPMPASVVKNEAGAESRR